MLNDQGADETSPADAPGPLPYEPSGAAPLEAPSPAGGGWTIAVLCFGLAVIAACVVIPQADANRRLVYEKEKLRLDVEQLRKQAAVNEEFLTKIESDPQLAERLAQRQMRVIRQGESELRYKARKDLDAMSPFLLVSVPPPAPLPPYKPVGGLLADWCRDPHSKLYLMGAGMMLVATGLVLGTGEEKI